MIRTASSASMLRFIEGLLDQGLLLFSEAGVSNNAKLSDY